LVTMRSVFFASLKLCAILSMVSTVIY
jgi:hypothetical protein